MPADETLLSELITKCVEAPDDRGAYGRFISAFCVAQVGIIQPFQGDFFRDSASRRAVDT
jgi:hypothetical protein